jgi:hypothetical protein
MFKRLKALLTRRPRPQIQHPEFGLMTFYLGGWSGQMRCAGREIRCVVAGSEAGPEAGLLQELRARLNQFSQLERNALDFICAQKPLFNPRDFAFKSVTFLRPGKPEIFAMEFSMEGDADGIWRVHFERGQPKNVERNG